ncbi:vWA domain-containing protein [Nocardioides donggukensis]|uniref:VWA domain-containing protein n=1 Tax=Nocardioides donggukensis TaxID=2774019 RepID=A0A927K6F8_9ACTN|nr:VWA domain-containing protein [Nocardioides donggukensis]MBD8871192.1 VWA domain-containing protein [Nocardioides donggukensis]
MALLDRHIGFVEALRGAGVPVSLAEDIDAATALTTVGWGDRETVRATYAATLCKRQAHRGSFDALFDLWFPALVGDGRTGAADDPEYAEAEGPRDTGPALDDFRERLVAALAVEGQAGQQGGPDAAADLAIEAIGRFGAMPGRAPGLSSWSAYQALKRIDADGLVDRIVAALVAGGTDESAAQRRAQSGTAAFRRAVEEDARRRIAEEKGPQHVAETALRPTVDRIDFLGARRGELEDMRRQIHPLARRLATRLTQEHHAHRRGPLDFRRTVRASMSTGGVPITTHHRPKRPHRTDLVVLCDVSGSVANFAQFTLLLVYALRDQFTKVRAFTFVDQVHEVTAYFRPGADAGDVLADLAASARHAALFGRTNYGRAFAKFAEEHADALGPRTSLLVLGDARSNYSDLGVDTFAEMVEGCRHAWWLNPEHRRNWGSGDSAALAYGEVVPMVECRNLTQLGEFVHDIV